jgi:S-adenosylmethionine:tRNA-ribosyltransferase-isomerase (queuine synthetase)
MTPGKLLVIDARFGLRHIARETLPDVLQPGDLVVANDAATLPASLHGTHVASGKPIEIRLAARRTLSPDVADFAAIAFGAGDFHTRTEDRPPPPSLAVHDRLALGPLSATVTGLLGHPRLVALHFHGSADDIWAGIARHGRPIQYAHVATPLLLWDVWTPIASPPVAFEPPSAGFALDWRTIAAMRTRGVNFATITHAAGISSTGDPELDRQLPFDEPYDIPASTARAIASARARGCRIVAIGTTVVRALEHAAGPRRHEDRPRRHEDTKDGPRRHEDTKDGPRRHEDTKDGPRRHEDKPRRREDTKDGQRRHEDRPRRHEDTKGGPRRHEDTKVTGWVVRAGPGVATQRIGPGTRLRVVDAILTGVHERGTSHYELLRAFADDRTLAAADDEMAARGYRPHEFGDSILVIPPARFDPVGLPTEL